MPSRSDSRPIAVTGSTGGVGGRVARRLAERGVPQRLVVRDAARAPRLDGAEVRVASDYAATDEMRAALDGAGTLFLVPAHEAPDRVALHRSAVEAAVAAGVGRIVYLSYLDAAPDSTFTFGRDHWRTEELIRASGVPEFTFGRMSLYLDFIPSMVSEDGVIAGPAGDGRLSAVARDDIADAIAVMLVEDGHEGATYDLTGPEAFTMAEAAAEISRATGREVTYRDETLEEAYASRASYGAPDWEVDGWVTSYAAIAAGEIAKVSDDVRKLTGREPIGLAEFLRRSPPPRG
jgi:NAD(P)H dehydrogenase (quinone)